MTRALLLIAIIICFYSNTLAQDAVSIYELREVFQQIHSEEDIEKIIELPIDPEDPNGLNARAYQAASTCMMAEYVFSPIKKLKYFNQGKTFLENLIAEQKSAENVYLRLLIQLNSPRILNYHENIEEDIAFLETELPKAKIDVDYKYTMIRNLVTLSDEDEVKEALLRIKVTDMERKL